jgi:probable blue pigment (indigoidine) exporter
MQVVTRRWITRIHPPTVNALRLWISALGVALVPGAIAGAFGLPGSVVGLAALAAVCGPFLGRLMMMNSAHYIPAATSTLMGLMSPVLALIFGWTLLGELPGGAEVLGGAIVVVGMLVAVSRRSVPDGQTS